MDADPVAGEVLNVQRGQVDHDVRVEVVVATDLVEELGSHGVLGDDATARRVLGHDGGAVRPEFSDGHAGETEVGILGEEREVAAGGLGPALDDVARDDRAGQLVQVGGRPAELPRRWANEQRRVGHPRADDDVGAELEGPHDRPGAQIGVGRQDALLRELQGLACVNVHQVQSAIAQDGLGQVVAHDGGDGQFDGSLGAERADGVGQAGSV